MKMELSEIVLRIQSFDIFVCGHTPVENADMGAIFVYSVLTWLIKA